MWILCRPRFELTLLLLPKNNDEDDQRVVAVVGFEYKKDNTFLVIDTLFGCRREKKNFVSKGGIFILYDGVGILL